MGYPHAPYLSLPIRPPSKWTVSGSRFLQQDRFGGKNWGQHLGEDCSLPAGTIVYSIGRGRVVYATHHDGTEQSPQEGGRRNWGGVVIIAHKNPATGQIFFSLYGHLGELYVQRGKLVAEGESLGRIAIPWSPTNGWWEDSHLHLGIYLGPWRGVVLPGYYLPAQKRTTPKWWRLPTSFIQNYQKEGGRG